MRQPDDRAGPDGSGKPAAMPARRLGGAVRIAAIAVLLGASYYVTARLSLLVQVQPEGVAVFWPAAGIAAGALIALGGSGRLAIAAAVVLATAAANHAHGASWEIAGLFGIINAVECLLVAWLAGWRTRGRLQLDGLRALFRFSCAALVACAVAALPAALTLKWRVGVEASVFDLWHTWLESDVVGIVTVAPLLIALPAALREPLPPRRLLESCVVLLALAATAVVVISRLPTAASWPTVIPLTLLLPPLVWLSIRSTPLFSAAGALTIALSIVYSITAGHGALGQPPLALPDRVFVAQMLMMTLSLSALALSAAVASQRSIEAQLRASEQRLRIATGAARLGVFELHLVADHAVWENDRMYELFGHSRADGALSYATFRERYVDAADRRHVDEALQDALRTGEGRALCRIHGKDGRSRDLEIIGIIESNEHGVPERLIGVMADITERRQVEERQALLMGELDHRVRNALETVSMLPTLTQTGVTSIEDFVARLRERIQAMARAHQLLGRGRWLGVELADLVAAQLEPYAAPGRTVVQGPPIKVTARATQSLSMVLHELATNAAKHGALSSPAGRITVTWRSERSRPELAEPDQLALSWRESGGPPVSAPREAGYGTRVIRESLRYELKGAATLQFPPDGASCELSLPLARILQD